MKNSPTTLVKNMQVVPSTYLQFLGKERTRYAFLKYEFRAIKMTHLLLII